MLVRLAGVYWRFSYLWLALYVCFLYVFQADFLELGNQVMQDACQELPLRQEFLRHLVICWLIFGEDIILDGLCFV